MESKQPTGQGWKWILGCGAIILLVILLGCGGVFWLFLRQFPQLMIKLNDAVQAATERETFYISWLPPHNNATAAELFPASLAGFQLDGHDTVLKVDRFDIESKGLTAVYHSAEEKIEVFVYRVSSLEKEAIYRRVLKSIGSSEPLGDWDDQPGDQGGDQYMMRWSLGDPQSKELQFTVKPPYFKGRLWWNQDWLFFFLTERDIDLEAFQQSYLDAVQGSTPLSSLPPAQPADSEPLVSPEKTGSEIKPNQSDQRQ